jgi:hypothetical protein
VPDLHTVVFYALYNELREDDKFFNYFRMSIASFDELCNTIKQWFPNGVSRHPGVSGGTTRCVAKLKKNI